MFHLFSRKKREPVTEKTLIGDLVKNRPDAVKVLTEAGMHCLGCPSAQAESLADACIVHGIDVNEVLAKLNRG